MHSNIRLTKNEALKNSRRCNVHKFCTYILTFANSLCVSNVKLAVVYGNAVYEYAYICYLFICVSTVAAVLVSVNSGTEIACALINESSIHISSS